jgi:eukaryotic-like serine/threonine-protein kinase
MSSTPVSLAPGTRLGPYEVTALIGAGGMGEVYRARDTNLRRDVALKILPGAFVHHPDRVARFRREAHLLAALNHPNIAHIYGLEDADGANALVMELVEGPTLADRIAKGPIPIDEALPIARQIAEALEAAHERGIIHRDLKPANVKVRDDGKVKVLDFGLAKAFVSDGPGTDLSQAPTRTSDRTADGQMLGTPAYMSPEQLRGLAVDKRTDIWAFGCVLYQLLTGRKAFSGNTVSDVVAAILEREPNWEAVPARTPAPISRLLRRCLDKDRKRRLRDIGDALADLEEASDPRALNVQALPSAASARLARNTLILATTVVAAAIVVAAVFTVAHNGSLVYLTGDSPLSAHPRRSLVWVTPQGGKGVEEAIPLPAAHYGWVEGFTRWIEDRA